MDCTCCRCGKVFDYEKYYGICPKCAAYNKRDGAQDNYNIDKAFTARYDVKDDSCKGLHQQYDSSSAHQSQKQHAEYHRTYDTAPMPKAHYGQQQSNQERPRYGKQQEQGAKKEVKKKSGVKWLAVFFVVVFVLIIALAIYMVNQDSINKKLGIGVMDEPPTRVDISNGAYISNGDIRISVDELLILGDSNRISIVPDGELLIAVHISIVSNGGSEARKFDSPMVYCDGVYRECLGDYDAEYYVLDEIPDFGIDADDLLSEYLYVNGSDDGYFFFFVPADADTIHVVIEEKKSSNSDKVVRQYWIQPSVREASMSNQLLTGQEGL